MVLEIGVQSQVESYQRLKKMLLDAALLDTQCYKVKIKGKVRQSREWSNAFSTPRCSIYWKGSLPVTFDKGRQLYLLKCQEKKEEESPALKVSWMHKEEQRKTNLSDQKQPRQHNDQQNNKQETKMGRKTTVWIFRAINWRNLTQEDLDIITLRDKLNLL